MKRNVNKRADRRKVLALIALAVFVVLTCGVIWAVHALRTVWLQQFVLHDTCSQIEIIISGDMIKPDVLIGDFGLKSGANLAEIDFAACRAKVLDHYPILRNVTITRRMPDKVRIVAEERTPVARIGVSGVKRDRGLAVDTEGVVFFCRRKTTMLPVLREPVALSSGEGTRLTGRALAGLRLLEKFREADNLEFGLIEVDIAKRDYLVATLGNYAHAKIAWDDMDANTPTSYAAMCGTLDRLFKAIRTRLAPNAVIWNATDPSGRIYADTKGPLK